MRNPIKYFGGKQILSKKLLDYIPKHEVFVEVFGGAGNLIIAKDPSLSVIEVYNDINSDMVNLYKTIRNKKRFEVFQRRVELMPYSRSEYMRAYKLYRSKKWKIMVDVVRASVYFYLLRCSFSGVFGSWSFSVRPTASSVDAYLAAVELLPELHRRMRKIQIEHSDFAKLITRYDSETTFLYLDPPYLPETRTGGANIYPNEMDRKDHVRLLKVLQDIKGKAILSGYASKLYDKALKQWNRESFDVCSYGSAKGRTEGNKGQTRREEVIWFNFEKSKTRIQTRSSLI